VRERWIIFIFQGGIPIHTGTVWNSTFKVDGFVDIENAQANDNWIQIGAETHDCLANLIRWVETPSIDE
jgi:hypothetical protein